MARLCKITARSRSGVTTDCTPTTRPSGAFCRTYNAVGFGLESQNRYVTLRLTTAALRTIDKNGIDVVLAKLTESGVKI